MRAHGPFHPAVMSTSGSGKKTLTLAASEVTDRNDLFAAEKMYGSGVDWQTVVSPMLKHRDKIAWTAISFDSDSSNFIATSHDQAPLEILGALLKELLSSRHSLERAIHARE